MSLMRAVLLGAADVSARSHTHTHTLCESAPLLTRVAKRLLCIERARLV